MPSIGEILEELVDGWEQASKLSPRYAGRSKEGTPGLTLIVRKLENGNIELSAMAISDLMQSVAQTNLLDPQPSRTDIPMSRIELTLD